MDMSIDAISVLSFTFLIAFTILCFTIVACIAFWRTDFGGAKSLNILAGQENLLRIATVVLAVLAVVYLAILGKLDNGSGAILGSIAAYVLGGLVKKEDSKKESDAD